MSPAPACSPVASGREKSPAGAWLSSSSSIPWHRPIRKKGFVNRPSTLGNETGCAQKLPQGSISTGRSFLQPGRSQRMLLLAISSPGTGGTVCNRGGARGEEGVICCSGCRVLRVEDAGVLQIANASPGLASTPRAPGSRLRSLPIPGARGGGGRQIEVPQGPCRETSPLMHLSGQAVPDCQGRE